MQVTLTITRYKTWAIPFAFISMAIFRLPMFFNRDISFFKLMGCGKNGTFDKIPDLHQWAILTVHPSYDSTTVTDSSIKKYYGNFINLWFKFFSCEVYTLFLIPLEGHGTWDTKKVFGDFTQKKDHSGPIATLTRATIRLNRLSHFWKHVAPIASQMDKAPGYITSVGIGEIPWIKQATFSIWKSSDDMKAFAYGMKLHKEVIKKTRQEKWYSEDMFVRFKIIDRMGLWKGKDPLTEIM